MAIGFNYQTSYNTNDMKSNNSTAKLVIMILTTCFTATYAEDLPWYASGNGGVVAAGAQASTRAGH